MLENPRMQKYLSTVQYLSDNLLPMRTISRQPISSIDQSIEFIESPQRLYAEPPSFGVMI